MIKVGVIAQYPAATILPEKAIIPKYRNQAKEEHPKPWIKNFCDGLAKLDDIKLEVFSPCFFINRIQKCEYGRIKYNFIPKIEPRRSDPYHLYLPALIQMRPYIENFNPDIIQGFGTEKACGVLSVNQKRPSVLFLQGIVDNLAPYYDVPKLKTLIQKKLELYVIKRINGLIVENKFAKDWAKEKNPNLKIKIIPHGINENFFLMRPSFKNRRIVYVGRLSKNKGCSTIIKAFRLGLLKNTKLFKKSSLVFIGKGPHEDFLKQLSQRYDLSDYIHFKGTMSHEKIKYELEKSCLLVTASKMDTSPNVITEAHAVGIPVIGTRTGGIPEMIENNVDGFIVPVDNAIVMSRRIEYLLSNMEHCKRMGTRGKKKVKNYNNSSNMANSYYQFYNHILNGLNLSKR